MAGLILNVVQACYEGVADFDAPGARLVDEAGEVVEVDTAFEYQLIGQVPNES